MNSKFTHLILSGGGLSGLVYIGIYRFLKEHDVLKNIHYMTGTSIGALFAFLFGLNVDYENLEAYCTNGFCKKSSIIEFDPSNLIKLHSNHGIYSAERFREYIASFLKDKYGLDDISFSEYIKLTGVDIHISVTCLNNHSHLDLSNDTFPEMSVITAVLASMSVPLIFQPIIYKDLVLVDGGCCANLEIYNVVKNKSNKTLYVSLGADINFTTEQLQKDMMLYCASIMLTMMSSHTSKLIEEYRDIIDIIQIKDNPIPFIQCVFENKMFYTVVEKKELDECIIFGYKQINDYFVSKHYL